MPLKPAVDIGAVRVLPDETLHVYPCLIRPARYNGGYSRGRWHAWPVAQEKLIPTDEAYGSDPICSSFWAEQEETGVPLVGKGGSPNRAHKDLGQKLKARGQISGKSDQKPVEEVEGLHYFIEQEG